MKRRAPKRIKIGRVISKKVKTSKRTGRARAPHLARARARLGWSIAELARRSGLSFVTVWRLEAGQSKGSRATIQTLLRALKMT